MDFRTFSKPFKYAGGWPIRPELPFVGFWLQWIFQPKTRRVRWHRRPIKVYCTYSRLRVLSSSRIGDTCSHLSWRQASPCSVGSPASVESKARKRGRTKLFGSTFGTKQLPFLFRSRKLYSFILLSFHVPLVQRCRLHSKHSNSLSHWSSIHYQLSEISRMEHQGIGSG